MRVVIKSNTFGVRRLFLHALVILIPIFCAAQVGVSGEDDTKKNSSSWLMSVAGSALGLKAFAESTRVVEQVFNRDETMLRAQKIESLELRLKDLREDKAKALKRFEVRRLAVLSLASRLRHGEGGEEFANLSEETVRRILFLCDEQLQVINGILRVWATILGVVEENIEIIQKFDELE